MLQSIQGGNSLPQKNPGVGAYASNKKDTGSSLSTLQYSSDSVSISYKNSDGEELNIEMEHIEFKSTNLSRYSDDEKAHWSEVVKQIKEEFKKFKAEGLKGLIPTDDGAAATVEIPDWAKLSPEDKAKRVDELEQKMPEAWRPDAVSDRIFQFVTAFYGRTESKGNDFYKIAVGAVQNGFTQAGDEQPKLPGDIAGLIARTRELVFAKLDEWAKAQGIIDEDGKPIEPEKKEKTEVVETPVQPTDPTKTGIDLTV